MCWSSIASRAFWQGRMQQDHGRMVVGRTFISRNVNTHTHTIYIYTHITYDENVENSISLRRRFGAKLQSCSCSSSFERMKMTRLHDISFQTPAMPALCKSPMRDMQWTFLLLHGHNENCLFLRPFFPALQHERSFGKECWTKTRQAGGAPGSCWMQKLNEQLI